MDKDLRELIEEAKSELRAEWRSDLTGLEKVLGVSFQDLQTLLDSMENGHADTTTAWHRRMLGIETELTSVQKHLRALSSSVKGLSEALEELNNR